MNNKKTWSSIQNSMKKHKKNIKQLFKISTKIKKNTSGQACVPCKVPRRAHMAQKEVGPKILGIPRDPLGKPKITKNSKKWSPKTDEKSEGFKTASQSRFRRIWGGQKLRIEVKNDSEMTLESEKTDFCKSAYFIGPADAGRLSRSWKVIKNPQKNIKVHDENEYAKKIVFWGRLFLFLTSFWGQLAPQEGAKNAKKRLQEGTKKHLEKKCRESSQTNWKLAKKGHPSINTSD